MIIHWKDWYWSSNTLATWCKVLTHLKRPWCWERLKVGEGDNRGWDGWMASPARWTWVWVGSGSWWWTGKPGVLQSMGSQRVGHDWATELNWSSKMTVYQNNFMGERIIFSGDFPDSPVVEASSLSSRPGCVSWSLFRELRSHMLHTPENKT